MGEEILRTHGLDDNDSDRERVFSPLSVALIKSGPATFHGPLVEAASVPCDWTTGWVPGGWVFVGAGVGGGGGGGCMGGGGALRYCMDNHCQMVVQSGSQNFRAAIPF